VKRGREIYMNRRERKEEEGITEARDERGGIENKGREGEKGRR
jgi:hypothetical protein